MVSRVVNQLRNFLETDLGRTVAEHEQHAIDDIGFSAAIGANNRREALVEGSDLTLAKVGLEVLERKVTDVQSRLHEKKRMLRRTRERSSSSFLKKLPRFSEPT
jgi:hypothetical protein